MRFSHMFPVLICTRLLASTTNPDISRRGYTLLQETRNVTYRWISEVQEKLDSVQGEISRAGLRHRLCMLATTCFSTFDVSSEHVTDDLVSGMDFSIAIECAVIVYDNTLQSQSDGNSPYLTRVLSRHRRLLHNLERLFTQSVQPISGQAGLLHANAYDEAFSRLWPGYRLGNSSSWEVLPRPNSQWISCVAGEGQKVYYNLLSGELIMGGRQFERLPQEIVEHPTYARIFSTASNKFHLYATPSELI
jgi:hypothetical protein